MNIANRWAFALILALSLTFAIAQEKKADTIHLSTEKIVNGESIVWDTIIVLTADNEAEVHKYLNSKHGETKIILSKAGKAETHIETVHLEGNKIKMIVKGESGKDGKSKILTYTLTGDDLDKDDRIKLLKDQVHLADSNHHIKIFMDTDKGKDLIWLTDSMDVDLDSKFNVWIDKGNPDKKHKMVMINEDGKTFNIHPMGDSIQDMMLEWISEDGDSLHKSGSYAIAFSTGDSTFTIESLNDHQLSAKKLHIDIDDDQKVFVHKDGSKTKEYKFTIKEGEVDVEKEMIFISTDKDKKAAAFTIEKSNNAMILKNSLGMGEATQAELGKIGIKTKSNKLDIDDFYIFYNTDKELKLKFILETEGKATIIVYDAKGKALFTDKVVYFPGTYDKRIPLTETDGAFYIYIEQGNASFVTKMEVE